MLWLIIILGNFAVIIMYYFKSAVDIGSSATVLFLLDRSLNYSIIQWDLANPDTFVPANLFGLSRYSDYWKCQSQEIIFCLFFQNGMKKVIRLGAPFSLFWAESLFYRQLLSGGHLWWGIRESASDPRIIHLILELREYFLCTFLRKKIYMAATGLEHAIPRSESLLVFFQPWGLDANAFELSFVSYKLLLRPR